MLLSAFMPMVVHMWSSIKLGTSFELILVPNRTGGDDYDDDDYFDNLNMETYLPVLGRAEKMVSISTRLRGSPSSQL